MKKDERYTMTVTMDVTPAQGIALEAMFDYWNYLSGIGSSRKVAFYADGDGNFHPNAKVEHEYRPEHLTEEIKQLAVVKEHDGDRVYDFDPVGWRLHDFEDA